MDSISFSLDLPFPPTIAPHLPNHAAFSLFFPRLQRQFQYSFLPSPSYFTPLPPTFADRLLSYPPPARSQSLPTRHLPPLHPYPLLPPRSQPFLVVSSSLDTLRHARSVLLACFPSSCIPDPFTYLFPRLAYLSSPAPSIPRHTKNGTERIPYQL